VEHRQCCIFGICSTTVEYAKNQDECSTKLLYSKIHYTNLCTKKHEKRYKHVLLDSILIKTQVLWGFALSTWIAWLRISLCCCSYRRHRISATFPIATRFCTACRGFRSFHLWKCSRLHVKDMPESFEGVMSRQRLSWSVFTFPMHLVNVSSPELSTQRELNQ